MFRKMKEKAQIKKEKAEHIKLYKHLWNNFVPAAGSSNCLQGELLRQYEKLRCEAERNGNINWCDDFAVFCDFISKNLTASDALSIQEKEQLNEDLLQIKNSGNYALKFNAGMIPDEELIVDMIAVINDELYDRIEKCIIKFYVENKEPIPYEPLNALR